MLPLNDIPDEQAQMLQKIGEVAFRWNDLEAITRLLLYVLLPRGDKTDCVICQLGNVALTESISAVADFVDDPIFVGHIKHYIKAFDRARIYRNHFIHGPRIMGYLPDGNLVALTQDTIAKGGSLRLKSADVKTQQIEDFAKYLFSLREYVNAIHSQFVPKEILEIPDLSSLQRPPLLAQLSLHLLSLAELKRQPQASRTL